MHDDPAILILAAGAARRMRGADKLLQVIDGEAQLTRIARAACRTGWRVLVALPPDRPDRAAAIAGLGAEAIPVPDAASGMAASIRAGVAAAGTARLLMVLPADMPELGHADLAKVATVALAAPNRITRATAADGTPGHPVVFPAKILPALSRLTGDEGARAILADRRDTINAVALPGTRATLDLDTPEDWAAWSATRGSPAPGR
ncbi:nucleotidyltransferase family protein [Aliigemmobacter aestuarii]|uniref:Nucleotidyltransferase family protein n=1 Tax=Aliigemmobacter aestuarii TaxID=1445661 RepID=A0A4S3MR29_9RHOB|nr:nucleotidyltransferase family protein [Gemmobacter aestuarii]THD84245.1 nucleotidyltransferase family protein [Gemmobacter aestuarii]